jgi:hypothetical protein
MAPKRPETYDEVFGQSNLISYCKSRVNSDSFPQVTLWEGEEGTGKTTIAKITAMALNCKSVTKPCYTCKTCRDIIQNVIRDGKDTESVKIFNMSVDGGKEAASVAKDEFNTHFTSTGTRVIIFEECHRMSEAAQDILNLPLENMPKGVYAMFLTTDPQSMNKAITSRFVQLHLHRLSRKEMITLLKRDASNRNLSIEGGDIVFDTIAAWSEDKPRTALSVLEGIGKGTSVKMDDLKTFIHLLEVRDIIPLISSLEGSILIGMSTISSMSIDPSTYRQLVELLIEAVRIKDQGISRRISKDDVVLVRGAVAGVSFNRLASFLYNVSAMKHFTRNGLIAAYLKDHPSLGNLTEHKEGILQEELSFKSMHAPDLEENFTKPKVPSISELLSGGTVIE